MSGTGQACGGGLNDRFTEPGAGDASLGRTTLERRSGTPPTRLKRRAEFMRVSGGRRAHVRLFTVQSREREAGGPECGPRFGLTVTKKVGSAVERNRIRRRLREVLRTPGLAAAPGHDYVIVARRDVLTVSFAVLVSELSQALEIRGRASKAGRRAGDRGSRPDH